MSKLTTKQERFCVAYVASAFNATAAAREAGYRQPHMAGPRLMENDGVKRRIAELTEPTRRKYEITAQRVLEEIAKVAFFNPLDVLHVTEDGDPYLNYAKLDRDTAAALGLPTIEDFIDARERDASGETIRREVRRVRGTQFDKLRALELLAKHHGLLKEVVEVKVDETFSERLNTARLRALEERKRQHLEQQSPQIIDATGRSVAVQGAKTGD